MTQTSLPIQIIQTVDAQEFWENVLGTSWEQWEWWETAKYDYEDFTKGLHVGVYDPENYETDDPEVIYKDLTVEDLTKAYGIYRAKGGRYEWDNSDAGSGDEIVQIAVFGEVIYG